MNWHQQHKSELSRSARFAEAVTRFIGSMPSIVLHTVVFVVSFAMVIMGIVALDTMLLGLTTVVSLEAIYLCLFLQNSSNRHGDAMELNAVQDYKTNLEAEKRIEALQEHLASIETSYLKEILEEIRGY